MVFLFFSFSSGKRTVYMVPLEPAAAILVGWVLSKFWRSPRSSGAGWGAVAPAAFISTGFLAIGVAALVVAFGVVSVPALDDELAKYPGALAAAMPPAIAAGLCGLAGLIACMLRRRGLVVAMVAITIPVVGWVGLLTTIPYVNTHKSARIMLQRIEPLLHSRDELALFGTRRAGYSFYWSHQLPAIQADEVEELVTYLSQSAPASILVKTSFIEEDKKSVPELKSMLGTKAHEIWRGHLGGRKLVLISNHQAPTSD